MRPNEHNLFKELHTKSKDPSSVKKLHKLYETNPLELIKQLLEFAHSLKTPTVELEKTGDETEIFRQTWENTIHKERVQPLQYLRPKTCQDLVQIVKNAEKARFMVRAVGKGHSFSDVANATDVLVDTLDLKKALPLETDVLKPTEELLFNTEAGMLVSDLNIKLDELGWAIPTMAAFDQETIYGAIATSTHGTGIRVAGMSEMVRSMDIVTGGGKVYRLEPSNGITDPNKFKEKYKDITLIQDDDKFHSSVVGFGMMGIVYSIVIAPRKQFYLKQKLWIGSWQRAKKKLANQSFFTEINWWGKKIQKEDGVLPPTRAQLYINPYKIKQCWESEPTHFCVTRVKIEVSQEEYEAHIQTESNDNIKKMEHAIEKLVELGFSKRTKDAVDFDDKSEKMEEMLTSIDEIPVWLLLELLNAYPELTPILMEISMLVLLLGDGKVGKSYEVMNQGKLAFKNAGYSVEPGFGVDEQNNFIEGIEEILSVIEISQKSHSYITAPISVRFVKSSKDYMSPEYSSTTSSPENRYNGATCMIDLGMLLGTIGGDQLCDRFQRHLIEVGARAHWGKICNMVNGRKLIKSMYPKFDVFLETIDFFDSKGTFRSAFSYRTGISQLEYKR